MNTVCRSMLFLLVLLVLPGANAQAQAELELSEIKERFDNLLPQLMRENNFDMWIHIPEPWNPFGKSGEVDPYQLGVETGYCIFTDRGGKKIERAVFEVYYDIRASDLYDVIGEETDGMWEAGSRFAGIGKFVAERNPQRIAIDLAGISHSDYKKLSEEFGEKYTERMASAEKLLADFRPSRGREDDFRSRTPAAWENI